MKNRILFVVFSGLSIFNSFGQTPYLNKLWKLDKLRSNEFDFCKGKKMPLDSQLIYFNGNQNNYETPLHWINKYTMYGYTLKNPDRKSYQSLPGDTGNFELTSDGTLKLKVLKLQAPRKVTYYDVNWADFHSSNSNNIDNFLIDSLTKEFQYSATTIGSRYRVSVPFYMEISVKMPPENHTGIQFNCFNYGDEGVIKPNKNPNVDTSVWSEVDMFEYSGTRKVFTHNVHQQNKKDITYVLSDTYFPNIENKQLKLKDLNWAFLDKVNSGTPIDTSQKKNFHKFGVEVTKSYIAYYIDDLQTDIINFPGDLITTNGNGGFIKFPNFKYNKTRMGDSLSIEFDAHAGTGFLKNDTPTLATKFPVTFEIDYVKYYKMDQTKIINNDLNATNYDLGNWGDCLFNSVTLGKPFSINSVGFVSNNNAHIRAKEFIKLQDGCTINLGEELYMMDTQTNNN